MRPLVVAVGVLTSLWAFISCGTNPNGAGGTPNPVGTPNRGGDAGPALPPALPAPTNAADGLWSNPATWGGSVPKDGAYVVIPAGKTVKLDADTAFLAGLRIEGTLTFQDSRDLKLASRFVLIEGGLLEVGTEARPFQHKATITLTGTDRAANVVGSGTMKMGTKFLGTNMGAGRLELHGARRDALSWTQLDANAQPGATSIKVKDSPASWRPGDRLVIASSSFDPREAEEVTVTAVNGSTVSFTPALAHAHWGTLQTYDGKTVDERAEVGLLTRDIVVQGADDSAATAFGGHAMMMGAAARVEGVEFRNMGQRGLPGRYAFHWHLNGDRPADYFRSNSVHHSFQRAVVVHQTNKVLVENNVAFEVSNHTFIPAEDGNEHGNRFLRNLGVLSRSPEEKDFAFRTDNSLFGNSTQGEFRSSVFWAKNFGNTYVGNHAAGALNGNGFFFDAFNSLTAPDDNEPLVFTDNVAHSVMREGARGMNAETYPEATFGHGVMFGGELMQRVPREVLRATVYKSFGGFWAEDRALTVRDSVAADNGAGVFILRSVLDGVTIVSSSANTLGDRPQAGDHFVRGAIVAPPSHGGTRAPVIRNVTVINEPDTAINYNRHEVGPGAVIENLKLVNARRPLMMFAAPHPEYYFDESWLPDPNGRLLGDGRGVLWVRQRSLLFDDSCPWYADFNAGACAIADGVRVTVPGVGRADDRPVALVADSGRAGAFSDPFGGELSRAFVRNGQRYGVVWNENRPGTSLELVLEGSGSKDLRFVFAASGAPSSVTQNTATVGGVASLAALAATGGSAYFFDATAGRLHLRVRGDAGAQTVRVAAPFTHASVGRAADAVASPQPGLNYQYFEGSWPAPRANVTGTPVRSGTASAFDLSARGRDGNIAFVFTGYLEVPESGLYQLASSADGSADVSIGGERLLSEVNGRNFVGPMPHDLGLVVLQQGLHAIRVTFTRPASSESEPAFKLMWVKVNSPGPALDYAVVPPSAFKR